jgi:hypothetical protein
MFGDLARAARHDVLALAAVLRVVSWAEAVRICLHFLEDKSVVIEGTQRHDRVLIDLLERWTLLVEAVGEVVETGRRFGDFHAGGNLRPERSKDPAGPSKLVAPRTRKRSRRVWSPWRNWP